MEEHEEDAEHAEDEEHAEDADDQRVQELTAEEVRVLGALAEKQLTTPQQYPLTLNALVAACNQTSNRDPVVEFDERTVEALLTVLKDKHLVRFVHPSHGRSVIRYRQVMDEVLGLDDRLLALVAVLMLRGPQTVGELRTRTERMVAFDSLDDVQRELATLAGRESPLVVHLPRQPGQKEARFAQLLSGPPDLALLAAAAPPARSGGPGLADEVAALREEVAALRLQVEALRDQLGG